MSKELMATMATGNRTDADSAFAELVSEWQGPITGYVYRLLRDWQQAEDCTQAVLLAVWRHAATYRDQSFTGWLFTLARHKAISTIRRRKADPLSHRWNPTEKRDPLDEASVESRNPLDAMIATEELAEIMQAMDSIPPDQAATLALYADGYSLPEIADASGVCLATCKGRSRLAREKVREKVIYGIETIQPGERSCWI